MSDLHEDNLTTDYKEKTKRKAKNGSRRWLFGLIGLALVILVATSLLLATRPAPKTVMEFEVQMSEGLYGNYTDMMALDDSYRVATNTENGVEKIDFFIEKNMFYGTSQFLLSDSNFYSPVAISPALDIIYTDNTYTTYIISTEGARQTIALNAPITTIFSEDGTRFGLYDQKGQVVIYDTKSRIILHELKLFEPSPYHPYTFVLNQDGTRLLVLGYYVPHDLYDLSGENITPIENDLPHLWGNTVFLNSNKLLTIESATLRIIDEESVVNHPIENLGCCSMNQILVTSDEKWLLIHIYDIVSIVNLQDLSQLENGESIKSKSVTTSDPIVAVAFSKDNKSFAIYTQRDDMSHLSILDLATMTIIASTETTTP